MGVFDFINQSGHHSMGEKPDAITEADWKVLWGSRCKIWAVGSRTIDGAAKPDSDYDFLALSRGPIPDAIEDMGYKLLKGDAHYEPNEGGFNSWRKVEVNLIVTQSQEFAEAFLRATAVAQKLALTDRDDRVTLLQAILYHVNPLAGATQ